MDLNKEEPRAVAETDGADEWWGLVVVKAVVDWEENDRHYYQYRFPTKNIPSLAYFSGKYELKKSAYKDISIEVVNS